MTLARVSWMLALLLAGLTALGTEAEQPTAPEPTTMATLFLRPTALPEGAKIQQFLLFLRHERELSSLPSVNETGEIRMVNLKEGDTHVEKVWVSLAGSRKTVECVPETPVTFTVKDGVVVGETQREATLIAGEFAQYTTTLSFDPPLAKSETVYLASKNYNTITPKADSAHLVVTLPLGETSAIRRGSQDPTLNGARTVFVFRGDAATVVTFEPLVHITLDTTGRIWEKGRCGLAIHYPNGDIGAGRAQLPLSKPWDGWVPAGGTLRFVANSPGCYFELGTVANLAERGQIVIKAEDVVELTLDFAMVQPFLEGHNWWLYARGQSRPVYMETPDQMRQSLKTWFPLGTYSIVREDASGLVTISNFTVTADSKRISLIPLWQHRSAK